MFALLSSFHLAISKVCEFGNFREIIYRLF